MQCARDVLPVLVCTVCLLPLPAHCDTGATVEPSDTAVSRLKEAVAAAPEDRDLKRRLAEAYLAAGNTRWAVRTLIEIQRAEPETCDPTLAVAAVYLESGKAKEALDLLSDTQCRKGSPEASRKRLLEARVLKALGHENEAKGKLDAAARSRRMYPEDRKHLFALLQKWDETYHVPATGRIETAVGWASDVRAGSPRDAAAEENSPSGMFMRWEGDTRWLFPTGRRVRPGLDGRISFVGYPDADAREESTLTLGIAPTLRIGPSTPSVTVGYRLEALSLLAGDRYKDGPVLFYVGHRGEMEVQLPFGVLLFFGGGYRPFREMGRSRTEVDGGIGGHARLGKHIRMLGALTVRGYDARNDAYNLQGLSVLLVGTAQLPNEWSARTTLIAALDDYPTSAGYFADGERRDVLFKLSIGPSTPSLGGFKAALVYEFANRWSTAPDWRYTDHRAMLRLTYRFAADPFLPRRDRVPHVRLPASSTSADLEERVQDLIRREEAAARSSSCVE